MPGAETTIYVAATSDAYGGGTRGVVGSLTHSNAHANAQRHAKRFAVYACAIERLPPDGNVFVVLSDMPYGGGAETVRVFPTEAAAADHEARLVELGNNVILLRIHVQP